MALLGDWNWYLPSWLRWLPELGIEGKVEHAPPQRELEAAYGGGGR
jgi:RND superfamily putative drug exporter